MTVPTHVKARTVLVLSMPALGLWFAYVGGISARLGLALGGLGTLLLLSAFAARRHYRQRAAQAVHLLQQEFGLSADAESRDQGTP